MQRYAALFTILAALFAPPSFAKEPKASTVQLQIQDEPADDHDHDHNHEHEEEDDYDDTEHRAANVDIFECVEELKASATPQELPRLMKALAAEYPEIDVISPIQGQACVLSGRRFGCYTHPILHKPRQHTGLDLTAPAGTRLVTPMDNCEIASRVVGKGYGRQVFVKCGVYTFHYSHLLRWESKIKPGTKLSKGSVIGYVGSTGLSSGPHLHFEVRQNGARINPEYLFEPEMLCKQKKRLKTQVACVAASAKKAAKRKSK